MSTLIDNVHASWKDLIAEEERKPYFPKLISAVENEYSSNKCFPPKELIFNALNLTPREDVRAVIIGQDPYHNDGQAHGLAFSVPNGCKTPPSLVNIGKELEEEFGHPCIDKSCGDLSGWAAQGVLLLNTSLTVRAHEAGSHSKLGWQHFTDSIIRKLNDSDAPIVFMLWGAHAQKKSELLDNEKHLVLKSAHPSPLSARKGFFGNNHFKQCNDWLEQHGEKPINWSLCCKKTL